MNIKQFSGRHLLKASLLGLLSIFTLGTEIPVNAQVGFYQTIGGKESLELEPETFNILESIGLSLTPYVNSIEPAPGFSLAALVLPPSSEPGVRGTNFIFGYDEETDFYFPVQGTAEFASEFVFNVDQNLLNLGPQFAIGNFSIRFDSNFEFSIIDTVSTGLKILDIEVVGSGFPVVDLNTQSWFLEGISLNFSQEFSDYLIAAGATQSIAGLKFAEARGERNFVPVSPPTGGNPPQSIPESSSIIALGLIGIIGVFVRKVY